MWALGSFNRRLSIGEVPGQQLGYIGLGRGGGGWGDTKDPTPPEKKSKKKAEDQTMDVPLSLEP